MYVCNVLEVHVYLGVKVKSSCQLTFISIDESGVDRYNSSTLGVYGVGTKLYILYLVGPILKIYGVGKEKLLNPVTLTGRRRGVGEQDAVAFADASRPEDVCP